MLRVLRPTSGAGAETSVPPADLVELTQQDQQLVGGRVEARGETYDGIAQVLGVRRASQHARRDLFNDSGNRQQF